MWSASPIAEFLDWLKITPIGTLMERADELRGRLLRAAIVFTVAFGAVIGFAKPIFHALKAPLVAALPPGQGNLHFTSPVEVFMAYVKVAFLTAAVVTVPFLFLQLWRFLAPAFPEHQRRYVGPLFAASLVLFGGGVAFCFFVILPAALQIVIGMGAAVAAPVITVGDYVGMLVLMLLAFGSVFQLPLVLIVLERLGVVSADALAKNRGGMLVGILAVAAIVTPTPDPFSQLAMAAPMYLMFEGALLVMRRLAKADRGLSVT